MRTSSPPARASSSSSFAGVIHERTAGQDRVAQAIASFCDSRESGTCLLAGNSPDMGGTLEPSRRGQQVLDAADERDLLEVSLT